MPYNKQEIQKRFASLPEDIQSAITSIDNVKVFQEIGKKHSLHIDQLAALGDEATLLMVGLTHPSSFVSHLQTRLNISLEKASEVGKDVNERVFRPIRESLRKLHEQKPVAPEVSRPAASFMNIQAGVEAIIDKEGKPLTINKKISDSALRGNPEVATPKPAPAMPREIMGTAGESQPLAKQPKAPEPRAEPAEEGKIDRAELLRMIENPAPSQPKPRPEQSAPSAPKAGSTFQAMPPRGNILSVPTPPRKFTPTPAFQGMPRNQQPVATSGFVTKKAPAPANLPTGNIGFVPRPPVVPAPERVVARPPKPPTPPPPPPHAAETTPSVLDWSDREPEGNPAATPQVPPLPPAEDSPFSPPAKPEIPAQTDTPNDLVADKLSKTVSLPKQETRYTVDPYREPTN